MSEAERLAALSDAELINEAAVQPQILDVLDPEDIAIIDRLASTLADKLNGSVISSSFPAEIGDWIRKAHEYGGRIWRNSIPMVGPTAMCVETQFNPDGTMMLALQDTNGQTFWRGTFRPVTA